jgi:predicted transglutaminase-like cysteine proteinase
MKQKAQLIRVSTSSSRKFSALGKVSILAFIAALQCPLDVAMAQPHRVTQRNELRSEATLSLPADGPASSPDLMRTVALAVSRTPLYDRWSAVANAPVPDRPEVADLLHQLRGESRVRQMDIVNRWMNHRLTFASDWEVYGEADHWAPLSESLPRGRGDCEDYAIGKMQLLHAAGVPAKDMYLLLARDLVRRADHALLVVRVDGQFVVMDSSNDLLLTDLVVLDSQPVMSFSGDQSWLHGSKRAPATIVAANAPAVTNAPAAGVIAR